MVHQDQRVATAGDRDVPTTRTPPALAAGVAAAIAAIVAVSLVPFFWATTFFTDDHLFLAFARYAPNPLVAFIRDQHGGEYYRPVSMSLWWLLARIGGGAPWPFALAGASLHLLVSLQVAWLLAALGCQRRVTWIGAAFFFLSPETRETALWFAALPDLLATAAVLGSLIALVRGRALASAALAVVAYLSKESAIVLPILSLFLGLFLAGGTRGRRRPIAIAVIQAGIALVYLAVRWRILGGAGGSGDERAPLLGKVLQIASGLVHSVAGVDIFPEPLAWGLGVAFLAVSLRAIGRRARAPAGARRAAVPGVDASVAPGVVVGVVVALAPVIFVGIAVLPLLGAGWIVGARYFYMPAVGLAWLAGQALARAGLTVQVAGMALMLALGGIQTVVRHDQVASYDRRVAAARRAVADGVGHGHRVFHIAGGIKDLDLAVKESPALRPFEDQILVLGDVPASFAAIPDTLRQPARILIATPPLPPSGAYLFGSRRIVGLARRGDDPTLAEVLAQFPDIRFVRLRPTPGGHVVARDVTEEIRADLD